MTFVPSGATGALTISMTDGGMYKATVKVGDGCGDRSIAEYYIANIGANIYHAINGISGIVVSSTTQKSPTFTQFGRNRVVTTWTGKGTYQAGDSSTSFDYSLTLPSAGTLNVTNNGNTMKAYSISVVRID